MNLRLPFGFSMGFAPRGRALSITEMVEQLLAVKLVEGCSSRHLDDLRLRLGRFAREMAARSETRAAKLGELKARDFRAWLASIEAGTRSRWNYAKGVEALVRFAKAERHLPKDFDELHGLKVAKAPPGRANVYSPGELTRLFEVATGHRRHGVRSLVPWMALRAFAGIREAEMRPGRMSWQAVDLENGFVVMERHITKTSTWRRIPIQPNLREWLSGCPAGGGPICPLTFPLDAWQVIQEEARVPMLNNALRDSYTTYRLAILDDAMKVSLETGNSPRKIMESYSSARTHDGRLVTAEMAAKWFNVRPRMMRQKVLELFPRGTLEKRSETACQKANENGAS